MIDQSSLSHPADVSINRVRCLSQLLAAANDIRALGLATRFLTEGAKLEEWIQCLGLSSNDVGHFSPRRLIAEEWFESRRMAGVTLQQALQDWIQESSQIFTAYGAGLDESKYDQIIKQLSSKGFKTVRLDFGNMEKLFGTLKQITDDFEQYLLPVVTGPPAYDDPTSRLEDCGQIDNTPTVRFLYNTCVSALYSALPHMKDIASMFEFVATRMRIWGMDLFTGLLPLDELLSPRQRRSTLLRQNVIGIWSDIAASLEHLLRCLIDDEENEVRVHWRALSIALSLDEVADAVFDEPEILLEQPMTPIYSGEVVQLCAERLEGFVDCLFDLSVTIGTLHQLSLAALQKGQTAINSIKSSTVQKTKNKLESSTTSSRAAGSGNVGHERYQIPRVNYISNFTAAAPLLSKQGEKRASVVFKDNFTVHTLTVPHKWNGISKPVSQQNQRFKDSEQAIFDDSFKTQTPAISFPTHPS